MTTWRARPFSRRRAPEPGPAGAARPLVSRSLTHALVEQLGSEIISGRLAPGARLPTEQELIASAGVSRTVVREAIAALQKARAGRSGSSRPNSARLPKSWP